MVKIPFEILKLEDNSYHLLVDIIINNDLHGKVVIDTGASKTILDSNLSLKEKKFNEGEKNYSSGLGGQVDINLVKVNKIEIGKFKIKKLTLPTVDLSEINKIYEKATNQRIIGLLGSDLLLKHKAKINYKKKSLKLY